MMCSKRRLYNAVFVLLLASASLVASAATPATASAVSANELEVAAYASNKNEDFVKAATALEEESARRPSDLALHRSLGYLWLEKLKYPDRAYPHLEAVYRATPEAPGWGQMLARAASLTHRTDRQIEVLREIAARNPSDAWVRIDLGKALLEAGRTDEAGEPFEQAHTLAPKEEWVSAHYGNYLIRRFAIAKAMAVAVQAVEDHPNSAPARNLLGDAYRANWDLTQADTAYRDAAAIDPGSDAAKAGLAAVAAARAPTFSSIYYQFNDTESFNQSGTFNDLSFSLSDKVYVRGTFNTRWFEDNDTSFGQITRYEEAVSLIYHPNYWLTTAAGVSAFQTEGGDEKIGLTVSATIRPSEKAYAYTYFNANDPVNDGVFTTATSLTQDVVGLSAGYQVTEKMSAAFVGSYAWYEDDNERRFAKVELAYLVWPEALLYGRIQYEVLDYQQQSPNYSSPHHYQLIRPVIDLEPKLTNWLWLRARFETPYVVDASQFGTGVTIGPVVRLVDRLEFVASYMRYDIPDAYANYSGEGFRLGLTYRF